MTGHFCPAVGTALTKADVLKFLDSIFAAIMFGFLAYQNFQAAERARRGYW